MKTLEIAIHLLVSAVLSMGVYAIVDTFTPAPDPMPALVALVFFAAYWGVWLFLDSDSTSGSGGGGGSDFLDSLF